MKYEAVSLNTKRMLSAALKAAMESKSLSRITVSEIVRTCGVNRKTFYYHFHSINELLKWTLEQEALEVVKNFDLMVNAADAASFVVDYVEANQHILNCAYDAMGRTEMRRFFYADLIDIICTLIDRTEAELGLAVDAAFKQVLADFCTEAFAGILINLFTGEKRPEREELRDDIILIVKALIPNALLEKAACTERGGKNRETKKIAKNR